MFSRGLSPGVTCGPFPNTLGFGAKTGSPRMRLRLFERLGRLVGWRPGSQGDGSGRSGDSRADGAEAGGRHRRNTGAGPPFRAQPSARSRSRARASSVRRRRPCSPRPDCRGGRRSAMRGREPDAALRRTDAAAAPALPPLPRNYSPTAGGGGGGIGRARIREAPPFGAAPVETATRGEAVTRGQDGASQSPADAAPRQPWYQVVGGPAGRASPGGGRRRQAAAGGCTAVRPGGGPGAGRA